MRFSAPVRRLLLAVQLIGFLWATSAVAATKTSSYLAAMESIKAG